MEFLDEAQARMRNRHARFGHLACIHRSFALKIRPFSLWKNGIFAGMNPKKAKRLAELLSGKPEILLIPHKNPDGDAIGACLGMYHFLSASGHAVSVLAPNDFPTFLKWMPGARDVLLYDRDPERGTAMIREAGLIFTLDFNGLDRTGSMAEALKTIEALEATHLVEEQIASCLYAGILTDTGSFKFSATTPDTLRIAAKLMEQGARHTEIHRHIYDTNRPERLQLLGCALRNLKIVESYRTAYITLSQDELDRHDFRKGDTEGFVNYGLSLEGIVLAAIFIENRDEGIIKISLRSQGDFSVNALAREHFEGGGHINAAGGKSTQSLEQTASRFEALLPEYEKELRT